ncbi:protein adenylyltransferase SelO family protein [Pulveribacter sp.]|uniref:protein adenylyltransferase SelO n=1 Tax=Pulveribacter sp. TaxID=2678893 RepID=UPI0028A91829|nr:YdiU family protein [Pulveribacter sp.]
MTGPLPARDALRSPWQPQWQPGFMQLGPAFGRELPPRPLPEPYWVGTNASAASLLGLPDGWQQSPALLQAFTGNALLPGSTPMASVYSGHQFGVWAGQLGDGRALLLGETAGQEVQLKGSGLTPYSRMGDGRAVLRSSIREFLCSEAMHGLGIPTTRALCVTGSPQLVQREQLETAAVVTRLAPSFVRFGHFEHFAARRQPAELRQLADYVISRYYPECQGATEAGSRQQYAAFLQAVSERTARLLAHWQAVGFCHGVMNTDNMSILGLTLDYGPFQFMDAFDPGHICNHSDHQGRYAFDRQPSVAWWNLHCLAQALMPLIDDAQAAEEALESYEAVFGDAFLALMRAKLGLRTPREGDATLVQQLLVLLAAGRVDWTIFWRRLSHAVGPGDFAEVRDLFIDRAGFDAWLLPYQELLAQEGRALAADLMLKTNPKFVLRNHLAEQAIAEAKLGRFDELQLLQTLLARPFDEHPGFEAHAGFPPEWASHITISCSS